MEQALSQAWAEPLLRGQSRLLERLAAGTPLNPILEELCLLVESQCPGVQCAILLVDAEERLMVGGAPSLPPLFRNGVTGSGLGPGTTPCGLAAYESREVFVEDLQTDPIWRQAAPLATALGLRSCLSVPISSGGTQPIGTFALYQARAASFPPEVVDLVRCCVSLASIAIRHHQRESDIEKSWERQALATSEARFNAMMSALDELVFECSRGGTFLHVWASNESLLLQSPRDLVGKTLNDTLPPALAEQTQAVFQRVLDTGVPEDFEYTLSLPDGDHWFLARLTPIREASHAIQRVCILVRDTTGRKAAELAQKTTENRFRELVEALAEGIAIIDGDEFFEFANPAAHAVFGVEPDCLRGRLLTAFVEPDQMDILHSQTRHRQAGRQSSYELKIHRANGQIRTLAVNASPRFKEDGAYAGAFVVFLDITDRVETEASLRRSENRFRRLFDAIPMGVVLHREGRIQYVNPAAAMAVGMVTPKEAVGRAIADFLSPEGLNITMNRLGILLAGGEVPWIEMDHLKVDGTPFPVESRMMLLEGEDKPVLLSVFQDITERKRSEAVLRQTQKLESLGVLAGGIAHDFNNLLTAMLGNLNLAQMAVPADSPGQNNLTQLEKAIQKASELTRQMLAYSGRGRFVVSALNLNRVVEDMADLLAVSISKGATLQFELHPDLPLVEADGAQLQQVVMNLVLNASEALGSGDGSILLATGTQTLTQADLDRDFLGQDVKVGPHVRLEVRDSGVGMSPEVARRIFDPFFTTKAKGRGLGLSAMQGILRGHHAGFHLRTAPDEGTAFSVYFPLADNQAQGIQPAPKEAQATPARGLILLVDDEASVRATLGAMLQGLGYDVMEAADGVEGLACFQRERHRLRGMVLDLTMPRMDGRETLRHVRSLAPEFPVLLNSGFDEGDALQPLLNLGPSAFLQKPYSLLDLQKTLNALLG